MTVMDDVARMIAARRTRRAAIVTLVAAPVLAAHPSTAATRKRRKRQRRRSRRCFASKRCTTGQGSNNANCDFFSSMALHQGIAQGANLSNANFTIAQMIGTNLQGANLSGACMVGADLRTARIDSSTNLDGAIFCGTFMPDGSINNDGCTRPTRCCPTELTDLPGWGDRGVAFQSIKNNSRDHHYKVVAWYFPVGYAPNTLYWHRHQERTLAPGETWQVILPYRKLALWVDDSYWTYVFNAAILDPLGQIGFGGEMKENLDGWVGNWHLVESRGMPDTGMELSGGGLPISLRKDADNSNNINFSVALR